MKFATVRLNYIIPPPQQDKTVKAQTHIAKEKLIESLIIQWCLGEIYEDNVSSLFHFILSTSPLFFHLEGGGVKEWHLSCNKSITYVVNRNNEILYYKIYFFDMVFIIKWLTVSPDIYLVWFLKKWSSLTFFGGRASELHN